MPQLNLGRVVGRDGGFGNASANYVDDGGEPDVEVNLSGEDTQKDIEFTFKNLVRAPIDSSMIDQITNDQIINSSKVLTATGLTTLWGKIKSLFALKNHTHGTSGIEDKAITQAKLADHSVGQQQLETSVWDSISQTREVSIASTEIAANNGNLVRTDIPAIFGYKAVGVVGMKIGMSLYTMYFGLENNNTRLRCDFLNRLSSPFSGSPGVATILYLKNG